MASWGPGTMHAHSTIQCYLVLEGDFWPWEQMELWLSSFFFPLGSQAALGPQVSDGKEGILRFILAIHGMPGELCRYSILIAGTSKSWGIQHQLRPQMRVKELSKTSSRSLKGIVTCFSLSHHNSSHHHSSWTKRRKLLLKHKGVVLIQSLNSVTVVPLSSFLTSCPPALSVYGCLNTPMPVPSYFTLPCLPSPDISDIPGSSFLSHTPMSSDAPTSTCTPG